MVELNLREKNDAAAGQWPLLAEYGGAELTYSLNFLPEHLRFGIAQDQASKLLNFVLAAFGIFGAVCLVLAFTSPIGDLWLRLFAVTLLADLWHWTRKLKREPEAPGERGAVDVKKIFSAPALLVLQKALLSRPNRQASALHVFLQLLTDEDVQNVFYRLRNKKK